MKGTSGAAARVSSSRRGTGSGPVPDGERASVLRRGCLPVFDEHFDGASQRGAQRDREALSTGQMSHVSGTSGRAALTRCAPAGSMVKLKESPSFTSPSGLRQEVFERIGLGSIPCCEQSWRGGAAASQARGPWLVRARLVCPAKGGSSGEEWLFIRLLSGFGSGERRRCAARSSTERKLFPGCARGQ